MGCIIAGFSSETKGPGGGGKKGGGGGTEEVGGEDNLGGETCDEFEF